MKGCDVRICVQFGAVMYAEEGKNYGSAQFSGGNMYFSPEVTRL
jgi:hypothetical protein